MRTAPSMQRKSLWRRIFSPRRVFLLGLVMLAGFVVFMYFYLHFTAMIDAKLHGEVFVRASGIYAAPVRLTAATAFKKSEIVAHLDRLGYLTPEKSGDSNRGRYTLAGNILEITPSKDADGGGVHFPHVKIKFAGEKPVAFTDLDLKQELSECLLEPELLTSLNKDREKRKIVEFKDLPKDLVHAITAVEDRRFFEHPGVDFRGLARAIYHNFTSQDGSQQGASTVTQQLVKNFFLTSERTLKRKLSEAFISILLETRMSKEEIFQMYCNEIYLGQDGSYSINGVGEAAKFYFNKDVINLTLPECAFLAAIIRGPGYYSPYQHADRALARRDKVLGDMLEMQYITQAQLEQTKKLDLQVRSKTSSSNADAPYFLDFLQAKLAEQGGDQALSQQSLRIYSTVDMELQRAADKAFRAGLEALEKGNKRIAAQSSQLQGALIAINPKTGEVLAMVGGRDYGKSQLNRAKDAHRQPGSVFKPVVYTSAIETALGGWSDLVITASSQFMDEKKQFFYGDGRVYEPDNYGEQYSNQPVTLRTALTKSLNVVAVQIAEKVGYDRVALTAAKLGLPKPQPYPSIALGVGEATPLEVARAYTTFPNGGRYVEPIAFTKLVDANGRVVKTMEPQSREALSPQVACIMTNLLRGPIDRGTAARARSMGFTALAAGKTGTSRDAWFAGFTPNLVCVVYVGFDDNSQLGITGGQAALPIWVDFMKRALAVRPELGGDTFPEPPDGLDKVKVELTTGLLSTEACPESIDEYFIRGTAPTQPCSLPSLLPTEDGPLIPFPGIDPNEEDKEPKRPREVFRDLLKETLGTKKEKN
ncbi:MAG: PBP1A family penicillin-binding protein [Blastocatellia bacterium]|nr:PBP1A family penicillin-binding protein [Blastocatellia bacterium]